MIKQLTEKKRKKRKKRKEEEKPVCTDYLHGNNNII